MIEIIGTLIMLVITVLWVVIGQRKQHEKRATREAHIRLRMSRQKLESKFVSKIEKLNRDSVKVKMTVEENDGYKKLVDKVAKAYDEHRTEEGLSHTEVAQNYIDNVKYNRLRCHYNPIDNPIISIPKTIHLLTNRSNNNRKSIININDLKCTCEYWQATRSRFEKDNPSRLCSCFFDNAISNIADFVTHGHGLEKFLLPVPAGDYSIRAFNVDGQAIIVSQTKGSEWLNVIADNRSSKTSYERFGFNQTTKSWSYGESPKNAKVIKMIFHDYYQTTSA